MSNTIVVYKGRINIITVSLGIDTAGDTITSEIRTASGDLIKPWTVVPDSDGHDGEYIFTLDNSIGAAITYSSGIMDVKRVSGGKPYPVFDKPIEVEFRETVTA